MIEYLESFKGPIGREKYVKINPKYNKILFKELTSNKSTKKIGHFFLF